MNPKIDAFLEREKQWKEEFKKLREIILDCGLDEELKWGQPCYSYEGKNVVLIHGFKEYCAILFMKGSLLKDPKGILVQQTKNVQAARQVRFTKLKEIVDREKALKSYVREAVELERSGAKVKLKSIEDYPMPVELKRSLDRDPALKAAFDALSPGRRKGYMFYVSQAKQAATRESRVEKCAPRILDGLGLDD